MDRGGGRPQRRRMALATTGGDTDGPYCHRPGHWRFLTPGPATVTGPASEPGPVWLVQVAERISQIASQVAERISQIAVWMIHGHKTQWLSMAVVVAQ